MADTRDCEQCGILFAPRREHARFCSARCRVAWNRHPPGGDPPTEVSALEWSIAAMREVTDRLPRLRATDRQRAFTVVGEAVWWVTIVDGTLVRHYPDAYDQVMAAQTAAQRQLIEGILAGLRFVRNQMGSSADHVDFIAPGLDRAGSPDGRVMTWTWKPVPVPALEALPVRGQEWETSRYRAYETYLQGYPTGETFGRAAAFLNLAAGRSTPPTAAGVPALGSPSRPS